MQTGEMKLDCMFNQLQQGNESHQQLVSFSTSAISLKFLAVVLKQQFCNKQRNQRTCIDQLDAVNVLSICLLTLDASWFRMSIALQLRVVSCVVPYLARNEFVGAESGGCQRLENTTETPEKLSNCSCQLYWASNNSFVYIINSSYVSKLTCQFFHEMKYPATIEVPENLRQNRRLLESRRVCRHDTTK